MSEVNKIKQICNVSKMLKAIKDLRIQLEKCTSESQQFEVILSFTSNFDVNHG